MIGSNVVSVCRSTWLKDNNHRWLQPLWSFIGDREAMMVHQEVMESDYWMHGEVEFTIYEMFAS
jgi:nuclear transport factor 2 (NTF2) superfamily protein